MRANDRLRDGRGASQVSDRAQLPEHAHRVVIRTSASLGVDDVNIGAPSNRQWYRRNNVQIGSCLSPLRRLFTLWLPQHIPFEVTSLGQKVV